VDVRDLADLQIRAMTAPKARGESVSSPPAISCGWRTSQRHCDRSSANQAVKVPTRRLPDVVVRLLSLFIPLAEVANAKSRAQETAPHRRKRGACSAFRRVLRPPTLTAPKPARPGRGRAGFPVTICPLTDSRVTTLPAPITAPVPDCHAG